MFCSEAHARTTKLLTEKKAEVEKIAKLLLEKEVITRYAYSYSFLHATLSRLMFHLSEDMVQQLGKRPFDSPDDMDKYLDDEVSVFLYPLIPFYSA